MALTSPGVEVSLQDNSQLPATSPGTVPLFVLATRADKLNGDASGIAAGTQEAGLLHAVTSRRDVIQQLGKPVFVTAEGVPVHGHEANEYGLHAMWSFMDTSSLAYYVRADIDLGGLMPSAAEPTNPVADGTYWLQKNQAVGGFFRRNAAGTGWDAVPFSIYTVSPSSGDGAVGDIAMDYSTAAGTIKMKVNSSTWTAITSSLNLHTTSIASRVATTATMWVGATAPTGAGINDYWWKTSAVGGGYDLKLSKYRASDATWVPVVPIRSVTTPLTVTAATYWEDLSSLSTDGSHPLKVGNGTTFVSITTVLSNTAPTTAALDGDLWFSDVLDFAMYQEASNSYVEIVTTTNANPTATQKVISVSAPITPDAGAIWVDISPANIDNFPVIKRWNSAAWEDITASVSTGGYVAPNLVADGLFWINMDDKRTACTVKQYDLTYQPVYISSGVKAAFDATVNGHWKPIAGSNFGRKAQRYAVVTAMKAAVAGTDNLRSPAINYKIMVASAYPELFPDLVELNSALNDRAHIVADAPFTMVPSGITVGREITVTDWKTNARGADVTGEAGFAGSGTPFASMYYPHALSTNIDGLSVLVPASTMIVKTMVISDLNTAPYYAFMGMSAGTIVNATSVGYMKNDGTFKVVNLNTGQAGLLYDNDVNPIENIYRYGLRNFGNRNMYGDATLLSKTNVSRLVSEMKFDMKESFRQFIGQPNDAQTWAAVKNVGKRYMTGLMATRAIQDFLVVCDENNNGVSVDEIFVDIAFIPIGATEFISVSLQVEAPGSLLLG